jgi:transcriptional regulator with XRE-family HTH domain
MRRVNILRPAGVTATRLRLGLSQQQLADHLGISRTSIAMAEASGRKLPGNSLLKLARLEIKMAAAILPATNSEAGKKRSLPHSTIHTQSFSVREMRSELRMKRLSYSLEKMKAQYKQLQDQLQLVDAMLEKEAAEPINIDTAGLQVHRNGMLKQLDKCSITKQTLLKNRIELLDTETKLNKRVRQEMI